MKYTTYILSALMALALSISVEAEILSNTELGKKYFDANWTFSESNGQAYLPQTQTTNDLLVSISNNYFNDNWNLVDADCVSCIELVADLDGYKLILIREKYDD